MREKQIEAFLKLEITALGGLCLKWESPGFTGVPDRVVLLPQGRLIFVELKNEKGRLSARQKFVHDQFKQLGHNVQVLHSMDSVKAFIERLKANGV